MVKSYGKVVLAIGLAVFLGGCGFFEKEEVAEDVVLGEDVVNFSKEFTDLTFASTSFDELDKFVDSWGSVMSEEAKSEYFDFDDVAVMNMFKDEGSVSNYEVLESFVEDGLSNNEANVVVVSKVTYSIANMEEEHDNGTDDEIVDFHDHGVITFDRTVVDVYRIKEGLIVGVERI